MVILHNSDRHIVNWHQNKYLLSGKGKKKYKKQSKERCYIVAVIKRSSHQSGMMYVTGEVRQTPWFCAGAPAPLCYCGVVCSKTARLQ